MLLDEFFPDGPDPASVKSESNGKNMHQDNIDSDDEVHKISSDDSSGDSRKEYCNENSQNITSDNSVTKTVLPDDLQELVKEALAELKPDLNYVE